VRDLLPRSVRYCRNIGPSAIIGTHGEVPEWTIGAVSKTVVALEATVGSNPTLSAERKVRAKSLDFAAYRLPIC
jgi:hypothetical protein